MASTTATTTTTVLICATFLLAMITESEARPGTPRFSFGNIDCDQKYDCDDDKPVCATDGNTYPNRCAIAVENQHRYCTLGDFNPVMFVHEGTCNTSGYK